jgi:hypothetical protein
MSRLAISPRTIAEFKNLTPLREADAPPPLPEPVRVGAGVLAEVALLLATGIAWTLVRAPALSRWKADLVLENIQQYDAGTQVAALLELDHLPESEWARNMNTDAVKGSPIVSLPVAWSNRMRN